MSGLLGRRNSCSKAAPKSSSRHSAPQINAYRTPLGKSCSPKQPAFSIFHPGTMFTGTYTAIVTPFNAGAIDQPALKKLIDGQVRAGVDGIVPVGTTGESPTVSIRGAHRNHRSLCRLRRGAALR